jgi:hypothetical protein
VVLRFRLLHEQTVEHPHDGMIGLWMFCRRSTLFLCAMSASSSAGRRSYRSENSPMEWLCEFANRHFKHIHVHGNWYCATDHACRQWSQTLIEGKADIRNRAQVRPVSYSG